MAVSQDTAVSDILELYANKNVGQGLTQVPVSQNTARVSLAGTEKEKMRMDHYRKLTRVPMSARVIGHDMCQTSKHKF